MHRLADSPEGFGGGTTLTSSGTEMYKCIFIGETGNKGTGRNKLVYLHSTDTEQKVSMYFDQSFSGQP